MADHTPIEWTDATWNITTGCSVVSPGCTNCYAMHLAGTRLKHLPSREGLTVHSKAGPVWNGQVRFNEEWLEQPLRWKQPRRIFVAAHGDLFHESVPDEWIDKVFAAMALCPQHIFQVLTKRAARMREYFRRDQLAEAWWEAGDRLYAGRDMPEPRSDEVYLKAGDGDTATALPHVWLGVSVEDQQRADERIPELLATPAARRFISAEPLLGPVDLHGWETHDWRPADPGEIVPRLDWVIVGGESGAGARPMHPAWARSLRDQCIAAGVPFFFKQWGAYAPLPGHPGCLAASGSWPNVAWPDGSIGGGAAETHGGPGTSLYRVGKIAAGRLLDGRTWSECPA